MEKALESAFRAFVEREDLKQKLGKDRMAVLLDLASGAQFGLLLQAEQLCWARRHGNETVVFSESSAKQFVEWLEQDRRELEDLVEKRAQQLELPGLETVLSLPVFELARVLLKGPSPYFVYQMMRWLQPTDLRELRVELKAVADNAEWPVPIRELASHLVVPL